MATVYHLINLLLTLCIHQVRGQDCLTNCACDGVESCLASIKSGNHCKWEEHMCQPITTVNLEKYQIIPIPTESVTGLEDKEECICNDAYFSSWINTEASCDCHDGMKALRIQYIGSTTLSSITFYHDTYRHYEDCIFTNVAPNEIIQCTSFPYSQFVSTVQVKVNGIHPCETSIDTTCASNILDTVPTECNILRIVGWIDEASYVCTVPEMQHASTTAPSDTGNFKKGAQSNRKSRSTDGNRRRMRHKHSDSSSASSSDSSKPWGRLFRTSSPTPSPHRTPLPTKTPTVYTTSTRAPSHGIPLYMTTTPLPTKEPTENDENEETLFTPLPSKEPTETNDASPSPTHGIPLYLTTTPLPTPEPTQHGEETPPPTLHFPLYLTTTPLPTEQPTETDVHSNTPSPSPPSHGIPLYLTTTPLPTEEPTQNDEETPPPTRHIPLYLTTTPLPTKEPTENEMYTETPTVYTTSSSLVTETISSTVESTEYDGEEESTSSTVPESTGYEEQTTSSTTVDTTLRTTVFKEAYCQCASAESWDDYHYLDEDGDIVIVSRENEVAKSVNGEEDDDSEDEMVINNKQMIEKPVGALNLIMMNDGMRCGNMYIMAAILVMMHLMW